MIPSAVMSSIKGYHVVFVVCFLCLVVSTTLSASVTTTVSPPSIKDKCGNLSSSCGRCVSDPDCLFCEKPKGGSKVKCIPYPKGHIIPMYDDCDLSDARWGICGINFKYLLIAMGVLAGVLLISTCCCIYCCCCRKKKISMKNKKEEEKWEHEREERRQRSDERKAERKVKADEIRRKYGLMKDDTPYTKMDA